MEICNKHLILFGPEFESTVHIGREAGQQGLEPVFYVVSAVS